MSWPDTDGDGVLDKDDACPSVAVPIQLKTKGCPWPDTDGDGVLDKDDECPTVPGLVELKGCPRKVAEEVTGQLKDILFNFNKATLRPESEPKLMLLHILNNMVTVNLVIGHTDKKDLMLTT